MTGQDQQRILRIATASLLPFAACAVQWFFWHTIKPFVWFLFFPTVFFSSQLGGMAGDIASTAISSVLVWYFFLPPQLSFMLENSDNVYSVAVFMVMGFIGADGATLVLRDCDQCHYADKDAISPLWKGQRFPLASCISGWPMLYAGPLLATSEPPQGYR